MIAFPTRGYERSRRGLYVSLNLLPVIQRMLAGDASMRPKLVPAPKGTSTEPPRGRK